VAHYKAKPGVFADSLRGFGYQVRERRVEFHKTQKLMPMRTNWDVGITIDAIDRANEYDTFVLMSGDADFGQLLDYLRFRGKRTLVLSFKTSTAKVLYGHAHEVMTLTQDVVFDREWKRND
jgi:uncharacterized LabA/DUF88 family protein